MSTKERIFNQRISDQIENDVDEFLQLQRLICHDGATVEIVPNDKVKQKQSGLKQDNFVYKFSHPYESTSAATKLPLKKEL
jgi:hypothetical protein